MSAAHVFDSTTPAEHFFVVPAEIFVLVRTQLWLRFREFTAPAKAASAGGGSTSGSGGGSTPTTSSEAAHRHQMFSGNAAALGLAARQVAAQNASGSAQILLDLATNASALHTWSANGAHGHTVTVPAHDHTVPAHVHGLDYGIFKEPMPASIDVVMGVYHKPFAAGGSWTLEATVSGLTEAEEFVDLTSIVDRDGLWRLTFLSAGGQPNGGRLTVDVIGHTMGGIESA